MRHGRFITTALVATAAMAVGPAWASAASSPLVDDTQTDFAAGGAQTGTWAVEPGQVRLKGAGAAENFDGTTLPAGWAATPWPNGQSLPNVGGNATVSGGQLIVDGARFSDSNATPNFSAPQTLEFRATFGNNEYQHVGFGDTFGADTEPWAMFSTGGGAVAQGLYARTSSGGVAENTPITGVDPSVSHVYRIEWTATDVKFSIDGNPAITRLAPAVIAGPMRPVVSDFNRPGDGDPNIKVDWLSLSAPSSGAFTSRVLSADSAHTVWGNLTSVGSGTAFETRTGNTATPDGSWSAFQAVDAGGAIQSPSGQYIQYRATLAGANAALDSASLAYTVDSTAPTAAINSADVSGTTATVAFSSPDADLKGFECSLDGGAFAACSSPKAFTGLGAGSHTVVVRATDKAGNVGATVSRTFSIASAQSGGGGGTSGGGGGGSSQSSNVDKTAPTATLVAKSLRASKKGTVTFTVGCPATEATCQITLKLKNGAKTVASKTVTVKGGKTKSVTLQLNKATRQQLRHHSLKVSSVLTATDAAGNKKTTSKKVTLRKS